MTQQESVGLQELFLRQQEIFLNLAAKPPILHEMRSIARLFWSLGSSFTLDRPV